MSDQDRPMTKAERDTRWIVWATDPRNTWVAFDVRWAYDTCNALEDRIAELTEELQVEKELRQMERGTLRRLANELHCYASCPDAYRERQMTRPVPRRSDAEILALLTRAEAERKMVHLSTEIEILEGRQMGHLDDEDYCEGMRTWFVLEAYEEPRADDGPITAWPVCCGRRACRELRDRITKDNPGENDDR